MKRVFISVLSLLVLAGCTGGSAVSVTRFKGGDGHQVRVHEFYMNENGWGGFF